MENKPIDVDLDNLSEDKSDYDLLNTDTPPEDETKEEEDEKESSKEKDEDKEDEVDKIDETEEEVDENEEEIPSTKLRPSIKDIVKEIPEAEKVFKKFPQLRDAYYREGQFSQIYPTIEDAKEAATKAESLDFFNDSLMQGSSAELLKAIGSDSPQALKKLATGFLPTLQAIDEDIFYEASIPLINTAIRNLARAGEKAKNNNMIGAAKIMAHFFHGSYDIPAPTERAKDPELENERKKLDDEKNQIQQEKFQEFDTSVNDRTRKLMTKLIEDNLDPTKSMSDFTKSKIIDEVIERVGGELAKDRQHMASIERLWKVAKTERFSKQSADRIITAFLSRAKQLVPEIRSKVKNEALGTRARKNGSERQSTRRDTTTGTRISERTSSITGGGKPDRKFWKTHSDADILKG